MSCSNVLICPQFCQEGTLLKEFPNAFCGVKLSDNHDQTIAQFGSCKGRSYCLINTIGHTAGIVVKPVVYAALAVAAFAVGILMLCTGNKNEAKDPLAYSLAALLSVITSPLTQVILAIRAAAGATIHPGIYYRPFPARPDEQPEVQGQRSELLDRRQGSELLAGPLQAQGGSGTRSRQPINADNSTPMSTEPQPQTT